MKKIILAPAVALAFTGLVASPVAAAESPSAQSSDSAEAKAKKAEQEKAEKEKAEAEKAKKEKAEAEKKAAEDKAAQEKAAQEKAAKEKAAEAKAAKEKAAKEKKAAQDAADKKKDDKPKAPKKVDPKPAPSPEDEGNDDSDKDKASKALNASLKLSTQTIKAEDLAEDGLKVTVTGLEKGDKVSVNGGDLTAGTTTASGSSETITLNTNKAEDDIPERQSVSLKVQRSGVAPQTLNATLAVTNAAVDPIDASLTVDPKKITAEDLADKDKGVTVTVSGVEKDDKIKDSLTGKTETAEADGDHVLHLWWDGNPDSLEVGKVPFSVTIDRDGTESETLKGTINVVNDTEVDPSVKLESKTISLEDFKNDGLKFTGSGFSSNGTISVEGTAVQTQRAAAQADELRADEDGNVEGAVVAPESLEAGKYSLTFVDDKTGEKTDPVEVTVTEDEDAVDPIDASLTVDPKEITAEDLANKDKGVTVTVSGVKKGDKIKDSLTGKTETAEADGDHVLHLWWDGNPDSLEVGKVPFSVTIDREGTESETLKGNINVVDDETEAPAEASLKVSPKTIEAADFANEEKGVTLAVENCEPGADVHFEVNPKGINVTAYENTVKADDEGRASVNVFGTSSDASAYVGSYTATATCGDDTMKDSFKVTEGANSGGSDGGDSGSSGDGSQLPRTGADLGGLTTGAMLLLVGGAAIALTGRKNKFGQTPTSF